MSFAIGLITGLVLGACFGFAAVALLTAGKVADMQDRIDALEAARMSQ